MNRTVLEQQRYEMFSIWLASDFGSDQTGLRPPALKQTKITPAVYATLH